MPIAYLESQTATLPLANLPPFPAVALKVLQSMANPEIHMLELSELIASDAVFSGEVLTIANSPLCGFRQPIHGILQATSLLGLERLKALGVTAGMRAYSRNWQSVSALRACWRHSLACALLAEEIAAAAMINKDFAYTAGIIHDLGRLALLAAAPQQYSTFLNTAAGPPAAILELERRQFSLDHCEAGALLVTAWNLPKEFADIVSRHHEAANLTKIDALACVRLGCSMADALGFAAAVSTSSPSYAELLGTLPMHERSRFESVKKEDPALRIAIKINALESS